MLYSIGVHDCTHYMLTEVKDLRLRLSAYSADSPRSRLRASDEVDEHSLTLAVELASGYRGRNHCARVRSACAGAVGVTRPVKVGPVDPMHHI